MNDPVALSEAPLTLAASFARAVRDHLGRLREGERMVRAEGNLEGVHLMRTSCRRLRATVKYLGGPLPRSTRKTLQNSLRDLMGALGAVRDFDVLRQAVAAEAMIVPAEREALQSAVGKRVAKAIERMQPTLTGERYQALLGELEGAAAIPDDGVPVTSIGAARIADAMAESLRLRPADWAQAPEEQLHDLRKSVKKVRYALEAFGPAYGRPVVRAIDRCRALQESLGIIQDSSAFGGLMKGIRTFAAGQFLATVRGRARLETGKLPALWEKAFGPKPMARLGSHLFRRAVKRPAPLPATVEQRAAV